MSNGWIGFYIRVPTFTNTLLKFLFKSLLNKKTIYNEATENKIILLSVRVYRTIKPFMLLLQSECKFLWSNLRLKTYSFLYYCSCYGFVSFCNNNVSKISDVVFNFFYLFILFFFNT